MFYYYAILLYVTTNYELPQLYQIQTHQNLIYFNTTIIWQEYEYILKNKYIFITLPPQDLLLDINACLLFNLFKLFILKVLGLKKSFFCLKKMKNIIKM